MSPFAGLFIAFLALAIAVALLAWHLHKKRLAAFAAVAAQLGLQFTPGRDPATLDRLRGLKLVNQGLRPYTANVLRGAYKGRPALACDFVFHTQTHSKQGTQTQAHPHGVVVLETGWFWPRMTMVPENIGHKIWDALGGDDIDFESDEFSRRFWVKSDDRKFAYDLLHPRAMEHVMGEGWQHWEIAGGLVCLWRPGQLKPEHVPAALERLHVLVEGAPKWLKESRPPMAARV